MSEFALETLYHAPRRNPQAFSLRRRAHCSDAISTTPHVELNGGYAIPVFSSVSKITGQSVEWFREES